MLNKCPTCGSVLKHVRYVILSAAGNYYCDDVWHWREDKEEQYRRKPPYLSPVHGHYENLTETDKKFLRDCGIKVDE